MATPTPDPAASGSAFVMNWSVDPAAPHLGFAKRNRSVPGELYCPLQRRGLDRATLGQRLVLAQG
jgi:hypothetical protein